MVHWQLHSTLQIHHAGPMIEVPVPKELFEYLMMPTARQAYHAVEARLAAGAHDNQVGASSIRCCALAVIAAIWPPADQSV
jgi:hypothetical protein